MAITATGVTHRMTRSISFFPSAYPTKSCKPGKSAIRNPTFGSKKLRNAHKIAIRVLNHELTDPYRLAVAEIGPLFEGAENRCTRPAAGGGEPGRIVRRDLEIDAPAIGHLKRSGEPDAADRLFKHQFRAAPLKVGEALRRPLVGDAEAQHAAIEIEAPPEVADVKLGDKRGGHAGPCPMAARS